MKTISSRRAKACAIPREVAEKVFLRDRGRCIFCHDDASVTPRAHVVSRADGGLGIEQNIVTACTDFAPNKCHSKLDHGTREERKAMYDYARSYLRGFYPNLDEICVKYKKYPF